MVLVIFFVCPIVIGFADEAATTFVSTGDPFHDLLNALIPMILTAVTGLMAWLSKAAKAWIEHLTAASKTNESGAFYALAFNLAGMAVKYAETKFGPDSAQGLKKRDEAVAWLKTRLLAIDPKMIISETDLAAFVDAAYYDIFLAVSPLGASPASK